MTSVTTFMGTPCSSAPLLGLYPHLTLCINLPFLLILLFLFGHVHSDTAPALFLAFTDQATASYLLYVFNICLAQTFSFCDLLVIRFPISLMHAAVAISINQNTPALLNQINFICYLADLLHL